MRNFVPQISRSLRHTLRTARPSGPPIATPCLYSICTGSDSWCNITIYPEDKTDAEVGVGVKMAIAENYEEVLKGKYPAKAHAKKVAEWIVEKGGDKKGTIYLEAQKQKLNEVCGLNLWIEICARYLTRC
jgi:hypothetical protein